MLLIIDTQRKLVALQALPYCSQKTLPLGGYYKYYSIPYSCTAANKYYVIIVNNVRRNQEGFCHENYHPQVQALTIQNDEITMNHKNKQR